MKALNTTTAVAFGMFAGVAITFIVHSPCAFLHVYLTAFIGIAAALISIFFDYLIAPKQIFGFWSKVLKRIEGSAYKIFAKPLGACLYCTNVYIYAACFAVVYFNTSLSLWLFIVGAALSHVVLAFLDKQLNS